MDNRQEEPENLTGVWHGLYSYPSGSRMPENSFVATLISSGSLLSGTIHEIMRHHDGSESPANAVVTGTCDDQDVHFLKSYDGTGNVRHNVAYAGRLSSDRLEIEGIWRIHHPIRVFSGRFLMIRKRGGGESIAVRVAETIGA